MGLSARRTIRARPAAGHPVRFCIRHSRRHAGFGDGPVLPDHDRCPVAHHNHLVGLLLAVMAVPYVFSGVVVSLALERFSIYLGHPIYSLGVCLFSLILASGLGSLASDWFRLDARPKILVWGAIVAVYLMMIAFLLPAIFQATTDQERMVRIAISLLVIMPLGFLLGFAFPTGMRLVEAIDRQPTPWFWGINGATGVLASVRGVMFGMAWGIHVTLPIPALCYFLLIPTSFALLGPVRAKKA